MNVLDVSEATFEQDVLERSRDLPVVVDFWAGWCGPCRSLGPILEKLANESAGSWVLAKVDVDSNPQLAAAAGVQGIPAVRAFKDGKQVAEFVGALPEDQVRLWLNQLLPGPADMLFGEGMEAEARGDLETAVTLYREALAEDPGHGDAKAAEARASLYLRGNAVDEEALLRRFEADPSDVEAAIGLSDAEASRGDLGSAFERLVGVVTTTAGGERDRARLHLLGLLDTVPVDDPRALAARKRLSLALY